MKRKIKVIRAIVGQFHKVGEAWEKVFDTASKETIMDLGIAIRQFYKKEGNYSTFVLYDEGLTPIHVAAGSGHLKLLQTLWEKTEEKYPIDNTGKTPLLYACQNGQFEVCVYLMKRLTKKKNLMPAQNVTKHS